jgi:hypothetical protein
VDTLLELTKILVPTALTVVGLYFANAFTRRTRQQVMERRVDAYVAFWPVTRAAASTRLAGEWGGGPLTAEERKAIFDASTDWYYGTGASPTGHGLFLTDRARRVYLKAKRNLVCPPEAIEPPQVRGRVLAAPDLETARGEMSIRQLSLLRWVMRFDLELHTEPYFSDFDQDEAAFLASCGIDLRRGKWRRYSKVAAEA